jgi:hypothetical protein
VRSATSGREERTHPRRDLNPASRSGRAKRGRPSCSGSNPSRPVPFRTNGEQCRAPARPARYPVRNEQGRGLNPASRAQRPKGASTSGSGSNPSRPVRSATSGREGRTYPRRDLDHARRAPASLASGSNPSRPVFPARPSTVTGSARRTRPGACTQGNAIFPYFVSISVLFRTIVSLSGF